MWICPKCGREFKRTNQGHYCGKAPETVLEYIASQPLETHSHLTEMMTTIVFRVQMNVYYGVCLFMKKRENLSPFLLVKSILVYI